MPVEDHDYVEESGPGIAELGAAERPTLQPPPELLEPIPKWEQATIEQLLKGTGHGIHYLAGVADDDWKMTEEDLERIAPPLTRIANRYNAIQRYAPIADPLLVGHGFVLYAWRSELERQRALRDRRDAPPTGGGDGYERAAPVERMSDEEEAVLENLERPAYFPQNGGQE
jgi:hypothetical protein